MVKEPGSWTKFTFYRTVEAGSPTKRFPPTPGVSYPPLQHVTAQMNAKPSANPMFNAAAPIAAPTIATHQFIVVPPTTALNMGSSVTLTEPVDFTGVPIPSLPLEAITETGLPHGRTMRANARNTQNAVLMSGHPFLIRYN